MPVTSSQVFAFALHQRIFQQEVINTFAFRVLVPGTTTDEPAYLAGIFANGTGILNGVIGPRSLLTFTQTGEVAHEKWRVNRVYPDLSQPYDFPLTTNAAGVLAGTCETANLAFCVARRGAGGGRSQVGRVAFAGQPSSARSEGKWNAVAIAAGQVAGEAIVGTRDWGAALGTVELGYWVGPKKATDTNPAVPGHFVACVTATARDTVRVQRSRTVGRGS